MRAAEFKMSREAIETKVGSSKKERKSCGEFENRGKGASKRNRDRSQ